MLNGSDTNVVYLSKLLKNYSVHRKLIDIFDENQITYKYIENTNDIWCRDHMPIQVNEKKFVQFKYEPSYLKDSPSLKSNVREVCETNNIEAIFSDINLDGGNVVASATKIIMTDRVFDENPQYNKIKLIDEIEKLLEAEVIIISQINTDMTGHSDGMVRFVDENTIIVNNREKEYKYVVKSINNAVKKHNLNCIDIPFFTYKDRKHPENAIGCYINYLEVGDFILLPIFEVNDEDQKVYDQFKSIFPTKNIKTINYNEIGYSGGLLNCTTWCIKE